VIKRSHRIGIVWRAGYHVLLKIRERKKSKTIVRFAGAEEGVVFLGRWARSLKKDLVSEKLNRLLKENFGWGSEEERKGKKGIPRANPKKKKTTINVKENGKID